MRRQGFSPIRGPQEPQEPQEPANKLNQEKHANNRYIGCIGNHLPGSLAIIGLRKLFLFDHLAIHFGPISYPKAPKIPNVEIFQFHLEKKFIKLSGLIYTFLEFLIFLD